MAFQEWGLTIGAIMAHRLSPANTLQMVSDLWSGLHLKAPKKSLLSASELPPALRRLLVHESGMYSANPILWVFSAYLFSVFGAPKIPARLLLKKLTR
jgi:hypothetical protein